MRHVIGMFETRAEAEDAISQLQDERNPDRLDQRGDEGHRRLGRTGRVDRDG